MLTNLCHSSTEVEHATFNSKDEGSNSATGTGREKIGIVYIFHGKKELFSVLFHWLNQGRKKIDNKDNIIFITTIIWADILGTNPIKFYINFTHFLTVATSGRIRTLDLRIISRVFYCVLLRSIVKQFSLGEISCQFLQPGGRMGLEYVFQLLFSEIDSNSTTT